MTTSTIAERLEGAVENAIIAAPCGSTLQQLAEGLIASEPEVVAAWTEQLRMQALVSLLRRKRAAIARNNQEQLPLPGFERIPLHVPGGTSGKRRYLGEATYWDLRQYLIKLRKRHKNDARVLQVKALAELMKKYSRKTHGITVREALEREALKAKRD